MLAGHCVADLLRSLADSLAHTPVACLRTCRPGTHRHGGTGAAVAGRALGTVAVAWQQWRSTATTAPPLREASNRSRLRLRLPRGMGIASGENPGMFSLQIFST
jgi:hypothetical protein